MKTRGRHPATQHGLHYTEAEWEFMRALDAWKREHHRPFPTCAQVLEVLKSLGYEKADKPEEPP